MPRTIKTDPLQSRTIKIHQNSTLKTKVIKTKQIIEMLLEIQAKTIPEIVVDKLYICQRKMVQ